MIQKLKSWTKKNRKSIITFNLIMLIVVFLLSIIIQIELNNIQDSKKRFYERIEQNCNNYEKISQYPFEEGKRYNLIKSNFQHGKHDCIVLDATKKENNNNLEYFMFNISGDNK